MQTEQLLTIEGKETPVPSGFLCYQPPAVPPARDHSGFFGYTPSLKQMPHAVTGLNIFMQSISGINIHRTYAVEGNFEQEPMVLSLGIRIQRRNSYVIENLSRLHQFHALVSTSLSASRLNLKHNEEYKNKITVPPGGHGSIQVFRKGDQAGRVQACSGR